jgi:chemotaxis protein CheX
MYESKVDRCCHEEEDFLSLRTLALADDTVSEVFGMMLGFQVEAVFEDRGGNEELEARTAIVGFSGAMRGSCQIRLDSRAARSIASAMLGGVAVEEGDASIDDAVGELCNMLAGGWKNQVPGLSSNCSLSPPTVISGWNYRVHTSAGSKKMSRSYSFDEYVLHLTLHREPHAA